MIRDTFFDRHRFVNVCRKEMVENWKAHLLRMVLVYGVLAIALVWNSYVIHFDDREVAEEHVWMYGTAIFLWGITVMGCLSASFTMEPMKTKTGRMAMLMTPATMFEKFLARWLVFTFGFMAIYLVAYKLADWTRVLTFMGRYPGAPVAQVPLGSYLVGENEGGVEHWTAFSDQRYFMLGVAGYFFLQSCFVLGSSIWPKKAFLKTFAAGVIIVIAYVLTGTMLADWLLTGRYVVREPTKGTVLAVMTALFSMMALVNWTLAYFRFKESEIINRW